MPTLERETQEDLTFTGPPIAQSPTGTVIPLHMHTQRCLSYEPSGALTLSRPSLSGVIIPGFNGTSLLVFRRKHREHNKRTVWLAREGILISLDTGSCRVCCCSRSCSLRATPDLAESGAAVGAVPSEQHRNLPSLALQSELLPPSNTGACRVWR